MRWFVALALALWLADPLGAVAQKPKKPKGKAHDSQVAVVFSDADRDAARLYFVKEHGRGNCPPGLAKKQNGCLPPGQAKKRYVVGRSLPQGVVLENLPIELSVRIGPVPAGYRYGIVDGDLVKLAVGTMLVADAIDKGDDDVEARTQRANVFAEALDCIAVALRDLLYPCKKYENKQQDEQSDDDVEA
jgi:hypothetical protein